MNINEENKQGFQELIEKYLDGKTTLEEVKLLVNYYESFQQNHEWVEELGPEDSIKNRMLINILETLQEEEVREVKVIPLYKRRVFQLGVAASLVLFITFNFFFNKSDIQEHQSIIVNNDIPIGTDKATLTLEDGSNIALEKGIEFTTNNLSSNGEELVYNNSIITNPEIAYNYLTIPRGGQYIVKLSDGTQVWLNSESKLKYPVNFVDGETREVELVYGEAYFDVSPSTAHNGAKFKVLVGIQDIEVLGTEFNIKAYKDENFIYTTVVEGKVLVNSAKTNNVLSPNQQTIMNVANSEMQLLNVADMYSITAWKKGIFSFKEMPLNEIMKVLSRWYDTEVIFINKDVGEDKFTGVLGKEQTIENILSTIYNTNNIKYEINNKTIIFR